MQTADRMISKYRAFISYSHADTAWGEWLHRALERYRVPEAFVGMKNDAGERVEARFGKVFRDRDELTSGADLAAAIHQSLQASENLVVICSPAAARSGYVNQEIVEFKRLGRAGRVHALIVDGEPHASADPAKAALECLPRALRFALRDDGELGEQPSTEVLAPDARPGKDGRERALLKLIAGLLRVDFDALYQRERRRKRRQALVLAGIVAAVLGTVGALAWRANQKAEEAARQQTLVRHAAYATALELAETRRAERQPDKAVKLLAAQLPRDGGPDLREFAWRHLWSLYDSHRHAVFVAGQPTSLDLSPDGKTLAITNGSSLVTLWDVASGREVGRLEDEDHRFKAATFVDDGKRLALSSEPLKSSEPQTLLRARDSLPTATPVIDARFVAAFTPGRAKLLVRSGDGVQLVDAASGHSTALEPPHDASLIEVVGLSADAATLALAIDRHTVVLHDAGSGREIQRKAFGADWSLTELEFAPDGSLLVVGVAADGRYEIVVWDTKADAERSRLRGEDSKRGRLRAVSASHDGSRVALLTGEPGVAPAQPGRLQVWDSRSGRSLYTLDEHATGYATAMAFSPAADLLATGGRDHHVRLWDAATGRAHAVLGVHHGEPTRAGDEQRVHRDRNTLASVQSQRDAGISRLLFSRDGRTLVTANAELGAVRLWNTQVLPATRDHPAAADHQTALAFSPDGKIVATADALGAVATWDGLDGTRLASAPAAGGPVSHLVFAPDGGLLAAAGEDGDVRLLATHGLAETAHFPGTPGKTLGLVLRQALLVHLKAMPASPTTRATLEVLSAPIAEPRKARTLTLPHEAGTLSVDGRMLVAMETTTGAPACQLRIHDLERDSSQTIPVAARGCFELGIEAIVWSPDGAAIAIGGAGVALDPADPKRKLGGVRIFDVATRNQRALLHLPLAFTTTRALVGLAFSPDGRRIAAAAVLPDAQDRYASENPGVALWDLAQPERRTLIKVPDEGCGSSRGSSCIRWGGFAADGLSFALAVGGQRAHNGRPELMLWRVGEAEPWRRLALRERAWNIAFAPGGQRATFTIVSRDDGEPALLLDPATGQVVATLGHYAGSFTALGGDGAGRLLAESVEAPVTGGLVSRLWDLGTGQQFAAVGAPAREWARNMDLSLDGTRYAERLPDGTVRIHAVGSPQPAVALTRKLGKDEVPESLALTRPANLRFSPDGRVLATVGAAATELWDSTTGQPLRSLKGSAPIAFSGDGLVVATSVGCKAIEVWDMRSGRSRASVAAEGGCPGALALSRDGSTLSALRSAPDGTAGLFGVTTARVWSLARGEPTAVDLVGYADGGATLASHSPDGKTLATSGPNGVVNLWDPLTGRRLLTLPTPRGDATSLVFAPDGQALLFSHKQRAMVWRTATPSQ